MGLYTNCRRCGYAMHESKLACPSCRYWNSGGSVTSFEEPTILLSELDVRAHDLYTTGPWDPCFGQTTLADGEKRYGLVPTGTYLLGGARGAGKSTLALQLADSLAATTGGEILYLGTEEAASEIKLRGLRFGLKHMHRIRCMRTMGTLTEFNLLERARESKTPPRGIILDSFFGFAGDRREIVIALSKELKETAVKICAPVIAIDHVTKDDSFAGPETLVHNVDGLLALQLNADTGERILNTLKNRFGPAHVKVHFMMTEQGLEPFDPDEEDEDE